jgi:hypothetical protein
MQVFMVCILSLRAYALRHLRPFQDKSTTDVICQSLTSVRRIIATREKVS